MHYAAHLSRKRRRVRHEGEIRRKADVSVQHVRNRAGTHLATILVALMQDVARTLGRRVPVWHRFHPHAHKFRAFRAVLVSGERETGVVRI